MRVLAADGEMLRRRSHSTFPRSFCNRLHTIKSPLATVGLSRLGSHPPASEQNGAVSCKLMFNFTSGTMARTQRERSTPARLERSNSSRRYSCAPGSAGPTGAATPPHCRRTHNATWKLTCPMDFQQHEFGDDTPHDSCVNMHRVMPQQQQPSALSPWQQPATPTRSEPIGMWTYVHHHFQGPETRRCS